MKIRLAVSKEKTEEIRAYLSEHGIETDDDSEFILTEKSKYVGYLPVKKVKSGEKAYVRVETVIYAESFGHDVFIHTENGDYVTSDPLSQICFMLDPAWFIRISASVIISRTHVKEIRPTLSRKFVLLMSNGALVDVTRSYFSEFKEYFGI